MGTSHQGRLLPSYAKTPAWLKRVKSAKNVTWGKVHTLPYSPHATVLLGKSPSAPLSGSKGLCFACQTQKLFSGGFSTCWSVACGTTIPCLQGIDSASAEVQILEEKNVMEKAICHTVKCVSHHIAGWKYKRPRAGRSCCQDFVEILSHG